MRQCVVILVILLGAVFCRAQQNLILNGRFEAFDTIAPCVAGDLSPSLGSSHVIQNWWNPTITSSDYYQRCDTGSFRIPLQISGSYQEDPYHLNAYVGLITLLNGGIYQEYIATHLKTSLLKNKHYEFKALVNSYDFNFYNTNIGFCLESDSIDRDTVSTYSPRHPANVYMTDSVIKSCIDWTDISIKFSPTIDSLRFLIIGTFPSVTPILIYRPTLSEICLPDSTSDPGVAYYLIDDVRVYCLDCDTLDTIDTTTTNLPLLSAGLQCRLYPNPVNDKLIVELIGNVEDNDFSITISDVLGKVYTIALLPGKITAVDLTSLPAALYFYEIKNKNNLRLQSGKVMKE